MIRTQESATATIITPVCISAEQHRRIAEHQRRIAVARQAIEGNLRAIERATAEIARIVNRETDCQSSRDV